MSGDASPTSNDPSDDVTRWTDLDRASTGGALEGPGDRIGPYALLSLLGEGGFGLVYLAERHEPYVQRVALKIIKPGMDSRAVIARFEQERQALAVMDHPHVAKVFDAGMTAGGRPYFVMEHVQGEPITTYCDRHNLTIRQRLELFIPVCEAVQHAHHKGIIHRDIKPSNVLVSIRDDVAIPKVIDFGVAKAMSRAMTDKTIFTERGQIIGTLEYMSPEQAEMGALDVDTRTDVYSLGVMLYELLVGVLPFDSATLRGAGYGELQQIIREIDPPKPSARLSRLSQESAKPSEDRAAAEDPRSSVNIAAKRRASVHDLARDLKHELDWIPLRAMRKNRSERYATPTDLAKDIRRYLAGEPLEAGPESAGYRLRKFVRRNRGAVVAAALVIAALAAGLAATLWQAAEARRQALLAEASARAERQRGDQLKQLADFQAGMLAQIDPNEAGWLLGRNVLGKFEAALAGAGVPEADRAAQVEAFAAQWRTINATDAARELIDRTILQPAIEAIDRRFEDQPLVDAQLRQTLAGLYRDLGLYEASLPLQESALATRRRVLGEEHEDTLRSASAMGMLLVSQGRYAEAEPYLLGALETSRRVLGEEHPGTLGAVNSLGSLLHAQGRLDEAEPYYRDSLEKHRRVLGEEHEQTIIAVGNIGFLLHAQDRLAEAEPYYREALEKSRRVLGEEHAQTLVALNNMGFLLYSRAKYAEAEACMREALEKIRRRSGEEHPHTLMALNNVGSVLQAQDRFSEAEPYLREALEKNRRVLGEDHPQTLLLLANLGQMLQEERRLDEAERCLREALEKRRRVLGEEHPDTIISIINLGLLLYLQEKYDETESHLDEALEKLRRVLGDDHAYTIIVINAMGAMRCAQDRHAEAVELLAPIEGAARRAFADADRLASLLMHLGEARAALATSAAECALAEANLLEAHAILVESRGEADEDVRECADALAALYAAWDRIEPGRKR